VWLLSSPTFDVVVGEELQHPAGSGAEVEHRPVDVAADRVEDRGLDHLVAGVQRAEFVPVFGDRREVVLRLGRPATPHLFEPVEVGGTDVIVGVGVGGDVGDEGADRPAGGEFEERTCALAVLVDHTGVGQQLEVARDAGLRLPQDLGHVGDGQFTVLQQEHDAQPCLLADRPEDVEHRRTGKTHSMTI
jgi:hypothetical protein